MFQESRFPDFLNGDAPLAGHGLIRRPAPRAWPSSLTLLAQPFQGSMQTKLSASCCQSTPLVEGLVGVHRHLVAVALVGEAHGELHAGQSRRMELSAPSLRVRVIFSGAAGCSPLAFSEQVARWMSKSTFSSAEAAEVGVVAKAERHRLVALVDDGQADEWPCCPPGCSSPAG